MIAAGRIGRPVLVRATWDTAGAIDAWLAPFPPDASPDTIDFASFTAAAGGSPEFDPKRFFRWRCYSQYGSGLAGARVASLVSAAQVLCGAEAYSRVAASGAIRRWKDGREVPDVLAASIEYDEIGLTVQIATSLAGPDDRRELVVVGTEGSLRMEAEELVHVPGRQAESYGEVGETWPKEYRDWFYMMHGMSAQGQVRGIPPLEPSGERFVLPGGAATAAAPLADFVDAIRSARPPSETVAEAVEAAQTAIAVATAAREGKVVSRDA
jgi:predicted dehydrogenase